MKSPRPPWPGEARAWRALAERDPAQVQACSGATFDAAAGAYTVVCFGQAMRLALRDRSLSSDSATGVFLLDDLGDLTRAAILACLATADAAPRSGQLIQPADARGGTIFVKGTHVLPLDAFARRFSSRREEFLRRGRELGGTPLRHGDMSVELAAFPTFPVTLIVWSGDDEFPARASLLLDSGRSAGLAADAVWAIANIALALFQSTPRE